MNDAGTAKHIDAARKVLEQTLICELKPGTDERRVSGEVVEALDRANLLRTGIEQRAVWACERYYEWADHKDALAGFSKTASAIGRESLEAKQPKPRYSIKRVGDYWCVWSDSGPHCGIRWTGFTEAQARAVADALNALEAK